MNHLISKHISEEDNIFILFDFRSGAVEKIIANKSKITKPKVIDKFEPITKKSYAKNKQGDIRFRDNQPNVMSIVNVYDFIEEIGQNEKGTLFELSFFSHSWLEGPILVNSEDDGFHTGPKNEKIKIVLAERDMDDKDGRFQIDFLDSKMVSNLRMAFNKEAIIWNWGCLHTEWMVTFFRTLFSEPSYMEHGLVDNQKFNITVTKDYLGLFKYFFKKKDITLNKRVELTFGEIKAMLIICLDHCYNMVIAEKTNIKTYGGLPGTGSEFFNGTSMRIATSPPHNKKILSFYKEYFNIEFDNEGLNYGIFYPKGTGIQ